MSMARVVLAAELGGAASDPLRTAMTAAATAGADAVLLSGVTGTSSAARVPYELSDFGVGETPGRPAIAREDLQSLVAHGVARGVSVVLSVADDDGLSLVRGAGAAAIHLLPETVTDLPFLARAAAAETTLWLDTAMASLDEVAEALAELVKQRGRLVLLHGLDTVPGRPEELNLRALVALRERFGLPIGFRARDAMTATALAAVALGAAVVVVPFGDARGGLDTGAFGALDADLRLVERALGDGDKRVQASEWPARDRRQRSLVARVDIPRGQAVTADMLKTAPPGIGLKPRALAGVVGRRAAVDIPAGTLLTLGMLE
jgi:N,N'-diacetyllegionaminate synthase